jgi:hypothetical protein
MKNVQGIWLATFFAAHFLFSQYGKGDENTVFSGPQAGEPLPELKVRTVLEEDSQAVVDVAAPTDDAPHQLIVFVHQLTRPSIAFTRVLGEYVANLRRQGIQSAVVFLGEDATETTERMTRARHALPKKVIIGLSVDGAEGPGAYGLNRNVTLTVLVAERGRVTLNQALIDPSLPVDLPKTLRAIHRIIGGQPPDVADLLPGQQPRGPGSREKMDSKKAVEPNGFDQMEPLLRGLIRMETTDDEIDGLAKRIEEVSAKYPGAKDRLKEIARKVHAIYGNERARQHLRRWAEVDSPRVDP